MNSTRRVRLQTAATGLFLLFLAALLTIAQTPLAITTPTPLPNGLITSFYSQTLTVTGGSAPYSWVMAGGTLPEGLALSNAGVLSGTVMSSGIFNFVAEVADSQGSTATKVFTLTINVPPTQIEFIPPGPTSADQAAIKISGTWPNGCVPQNPVVSILGTDIRLNTSNPAQVCTAAMTPYSLTANVGRLPVNTYQVVVSHTFPGGLVELLRTTLSVVNPTPTISSLSPQTITAGITSLTLTVNGTNFINGSQVRWNGANRATTFVSSTQLTAIITTADLATAGTASVTVFNPLPGGGVSNAQSVTINPPLAITTTATLPGGIFGRSYTQTLNATGGTSPLRWSVTAGTLPSGLTLNENGQLAGTPAVFGDFSFTAQVRDSFLTTAARTFTLKIEGGADLVVTQNTSFNQNQSLVTYSITIINNGPAPAQSVTVTDTLPATVTFASCAATSGGVCEGAGNNRTVKFASLASGASALITLTATPVCATLGTQNFNHTVTIVSQTPDQNPANNSTTATVSLNCQTIPRLTLAGGKTAFNFGTVAANSTSAPDTFTIENNGNAAFTVSFNVRRTGSDVTSGKITNADDNTTFPLRLVNNDGSETAIVPGASSNQVTFAAGQRRNFRILFTPNIPAPSGKTSGFTASQIMSEAITSELAFTLSNGALTPVALAGNVDTRALLIHPLAPKLPPLVAIARNGDELSVEVSLYDPNNDIYLLAWQFLDNAGQTIGTILNEPVNLATASLLKGQSFTVVKKFNLGGTSVQRVRVFVYDLTSTESALSATPGTVMGRIVNVSAASYRDTAQASEAIVTAFGSQLATQTKLLDRLPLPLNLGGTQIFIRDSQDIERAAPLFFVSPMQINYLIPEGTAPGLATVLVTSGDQVVAQETRMIEAVAPGLFTANSNGAGVASALALRVRQDNSLSYESVAEFDGQKFVARPLEFGDRDELFLVLFGTGLRQHNGNVAARLGGSDVEVLYAGAQGGFAGLDQINLRIPRALAGRGEVELTITVDGKASNTVRLAFR